MAVRLPPQRSPGWYLVGVSVVLAAVTVFVGTRNPPNPLATALLQGITLVFGVYGSWILGIASARDAATEVIRPHARSAFRRMQNLYRGLGRQEVAIQESLLRLEGLSTTAAKTVHYEHVRSSMLLLRAMVTEQIATADDALDDWRDIVPEEVAEIERSAVVAADEGDFQ